jgi:hypothetical protein
VPEVGSSLVLGCCMVNEGCVGLLQGCSAGDVGVPDVTIIQHEYGKFSFPPYDMHADTCTNYIFLSWSTRCNASCTLLL